MFSQSQFEKKIDHLDGKSFQSYRSLENVTIECNDFLLSFMHIQRSVGAFPASVCRLQIKKEDSFLSKWSYASDAGKKACADYIVRKLNDGIECFAKQNRGVDGSGSFQPLVLPQQVLSRNVVHFSPLRLFFRISLPGNRRNRIMAKQAATMLFEELPAIVGFIKSSLKDRKSLKAHCDSVEDSLYLQSILEKENLVAFVADGSVLPRLSGESDKPARFGVIPFQAPEELAVSLQVPNSGWLRGLGVRPGVTVLVGGGFHGKSTFLNALAKGVYPHVKGDGREQVVTTANAVTVSAEDGRSVRGLDIASFISSLPNSCEPEKFYTDNASGSTSQAAAIVEGVASGASLLLIDEDSSATNFLIRDRNMRKLIPEDPITPLFDRVRELYRNYGVSTIIVAGGSSDYLGVADQVIAMRDYRPECMTRQAKALNLPGQSVVDEPLRIEDTRTLLPDNFNPAFINERLKKNMPSRIKPLRKQENDFLEYGQELLDLSHLSALVDADQLTTIGYSLYMARTRLLGRGEFSPALLAAEIIKIIEKQGWQVLQPSKEPPLFLSEVRAQELAAAMNRLRSLNVSTA